ncbi:hypothetical protein COU75_03875 [Candidatus Peregrinibacteria bacterium CG10_big_fil_rev_8_21_14_0_10_42_8]|nr:MAG: hypothetical protein COU75_03875 [Candidatus Peregrinibacteria bacterium CG10_big_fil_rev_8_21_14_0_10_42_8]
MIILYVLIGLALLSILVVAFRIGRRKTLSSVTCANIWKLWERVESLDDHNQKVMEAEKVVDVLFKELDLRGSFATKLKEVEAYIPDKEYVWAAHKLRNQIAHEPGFDARSRDAKLAVKAFYKVIQKYCS